MNPDKDANERVKLHKRLRWHRLITPIALTGTCISLALVGYLTVTQRTFVSPPVVQHAYWVGAHEADRQYIEDMSDYVLTSLETVTPANVKYRSDRILKMAHPDSYGTLAAKFEQNAQQLKHDGVSTVWEPGTVGASNNNLCAKWTGSLRRWVGDKPLTAVTKTYLVAFDIDRQGTLYVKTADEYSPSLAADVGCQ